MEPPNKWAHLASYSCKDSPFLELQTPLTWGEALKMALLAPLVPVRGLLAVAILSVMYCVAKLVDLGAPKNEPLSRTRRAVLLAVNRPLCALLLGVGGVWVRVRGWAHVAEAQAAGAVGVFNHVSFWDAVVLYRLLIPPGVSRASNARMPFVGPIVSANRNIYLPEGKLLRGAHQSAGGSITERITARVRDGRYPMLMMAPEGTTANGRCLLQFRTGAFVAGAPVLPVLLAYDRRRHNPAWTLCDMRVCVLRCLTQWASPVTVTFLPVIHPTAAERRDPALYAENVRRRMADAAGLPLRDESHFEYCCLRKARISATRDGSRLSAPPGVLGQNGVLDLRPYAEMVDAARATRNKAT